MIRKHSVLVVAFLIVASLWVGARFNGSFLSQPAEAQAKSTEALKWEYCAVHSISDETKKATIQFLTTTGTRWETWDAGSDPYAGTFARLGSDGWELVGQVDFRMRSAEHRPDTWLFKRQAR